MENTVQLCSLKRFLELLGKDLSVNRLVWHRVEDKTLDLAVRNGSKAGTICGLLRRPRT